MIADIPPLLTDEQIYENICRLYVEKPNFIRHVIISSFPIRKLSRVESFFKSELRNRMCCLSNQRLIDIQHVARIIQKQSTDKMPLSLVCENLLDIRTPIQLMEKSLLNRKVALIGVNTNRMICLQAYNQLTRFIVERLDQNDPLMLKIITKCIYEAFVEEAKKRFDLSVSWHKLSKESKTTFINFIAERTIPQMKINHSYIWEMYSGRKLHKYGGTHN